MATAQNRELISYVDSTHAEWRDTRPGSRRKVLYEDAATGQLTMLVQWDPGYQWVSLNTTNTMNICTSSQVRSWIIIGRQGPARTF
jgi:hypothetical protein